MSNNKTLSRTERVMKAMENIDWTAYLKQKAWLSRQIDSPTPPDGVHRPEYPEGILNLMDALQDAWEGEGVEAAQTVWTELEDVPMNPETERIEQDWRCFRAGTHREDIWQWFEQVYDVPVHDLMYGEDKKTRLALGIAEHDDTQRIRS